MTETERTEGSLLEEFRNLGKNLVDVLHTAWERPERKRLQQEIGEGLSELAVTLRQEVQAFQESPTGQRVREEFEDLRQRIRSGEVEAQVREDLLSALQQVNQELKNAAIRWGDFQRQEEPEKPETGAAGGE